MMHCIFCYGLFSVTVHFPACSKAPLQSRQQQIFLHQVNNNSSKGLLDCCFFSNSFTRVLFSESNSDDNLLKNIELFEKLSLSYNGRVLFIKDVIGDEICCWSFYGQGRKLAEICCTSIVYATEKKQTKVGSRLCTTI